MLANKCACTAGELEIRWPIIRRYFTQDKHDSSRLRNKVADVYRKNYFIFLKRQKKNIKKRWKPVPDNQHEINEIADSGNPTGNATVHTVVIPKRDETIRDDTRREIPPTPSVDGFDTFRQLYESTGKALNERDWLAAAKCATEDGILDWEPVQSALRTDLKKWKSKGTPMDLIPWPKNYLRSAGWLRAAAIRKRADVSEEPIDPQWLENRKQTERDYAELIAKQNPAGAK